MSDEFYMTEALRLARAAGKCGDVPVGCVIVRGEEIVGRGRNRREEIHDATAHAELEALRQASQSLGRWRLSDCTLYVTLEPCPMCLPHVRRGNLERPHRTGGLWSGGRKGGLLRVQAPFGPGGLPPLGGDHGRRPPGGVRPSAGRVLPAAALRKSLFFCNILLRTFVITLWHTKSSTKQYSVFHFSPPFLGRRH